MPQMFPLNWLMLYFYFLFLFLLLIINNYYLSNLIIKKDKMITTLNTKFNKLNWKW